MTSATIGSGLALERRNPDDLSEWNLIPEAVEIQDFGAESALVERTPWQERDRQYVETLKDGSTLALTLNCRPTDEHQTAALISDYANKRRVEFRLRMPDSGGVFTFIALVKKWDTVGATPDGVLRIQFALKISGSIRYSSFGGGLLEAAAEAGATFGAVVHSYGSIAEGAVADDAFDATSTTPPRRFEFSVLLEDDSFLYGIPRSRHAVPAEEAPPEVAPQTDELVLLENDFNYGLPRSIRGIPVQVETATGNFIAWIQFDNELYDASHHRIRGRRGAISEPEAGAPSDDMAAALLDNDLFDASRHRIRSRRLQPAITDTLLFEDGDDFLLEDGDTLQLE